MDRVLNVGLIGASAERGWAKDSHVPAVAALDGLRFAAVVGSTQASADAAARAFGAAHAFGAAENLFGDPSIDIVAVAVKVPDHRALVLAAVAAGKHVYCEWPLGRDLAETEELAAAVRAAGVHAAIGLQTRMNPAALRAKALVESGAIGRVLSAGIVSTTMAFGPTVEPQMAFGELSANGVTLPTIQGAHTADLVAAVLGPLAEAGALLTTQFPDVSIGQERHARTTADHMLLQGWLPSGAAVSIQVAGGRPAAAVPFRFEIVGTTGTLTLEGGAPRGFQSGRLTLSLNGERQPVDDDDLPDAAFNVARVYAALRDDIFTGTQTAPGVDHAVRLARFVEDMAASSDTGVRRPASDWPR